MKTALVFSVGTAFGYGLAMSHQEPNGEIKAATAEFIRTLKGICADAWLDAKLAARETQDG